MPTKNFPNKLAQRKRSKPIRTAAIPPISPRDAQKSFRNALGSQIVRPHYASQNVAPVTLWVQARYSVGRHSWIGEDFRPCYASYPRPRYGNAQIH